VGNLFRGAPLSESDEMDRAHGNNRIDGGICTGSRFVGCSQCDAQFSQF